MKTKYNSIGQPLVRLGNLRNFLCAAALAAFLVPAARASDPTGIYGFVDKVVFEPSDSAPERVQVWGGFALSKKSTGNSEYQDAQRGYMYFKLRPGSEEVCKKEWADLKSVAGTGEIVAFGSRRFDPQPTVRKADTKVADPDVYPGSWGMTKARKTEEYPPIGQLVKLLGKPAAKKSSGGN